MFGWLVGCLLVCVGLCFVARLGCLLLVHFVVRDICAWWFIYFVDCFGWLDLLDCVLVYLIMCTDACYFLLVWCLLFWFVMLVALHCLLWLFLAIILGGCYFIVLVFMWFGLIVLCILFLVYCSMVILCVCCLLFDLIWLFDSIVCCLRFDWLVLGLLFVIIMTVYCLALVVWVLFGRFCVLDVFCFLCLITV